MASSVIIIGPAACGKTRNGERLRLHYQLDLIVDTGMEMPHRDWAVPRDGVLVLAIYPDEIHNPNAVRVVKFSDAMKEIGDESV